MNPFKDFGEGRNTFKLMLIIIRFYEGFEPIEYFDFTRAKNDSRKFNKYVVNGLATKKYYFFVCFRHELL